MRVHRKLCLAAAASAALPATAEAVTQDHARAYERVYSAVQRKLGHRAPGRNIVRWNLPSGRRPSDRRVLVSLGVLRRMLVPRAAVVTATTLQVPQDSAPAAPEPTTSTAPTAVVSAAPASGLEACIIAHESGGNPQATNGQYGGIGQWSPSAWAQDGGTKYAASPTGATYSQQQAVLSGEGSSRLDPPMAQQQGQFDGC